MPGAGTIGLLVCFAFCAIFVGSAGTRPFFLNALADKRRSRRRPRCPETVRSVSPTWGEDGGEGTLFSLSQVAIRRVIWFEWIES